MERRVLSPRDACSPQASRTLFYVPVDSRLRKRRLRHYGIPGMIAGGTLLKKPLALK